MAKNIALGAYSVTASKKYIVVSTPFAPADRWNISVNVVLSAAAKTNAITFELEDSFDGGVSWGLVGSESQIAVASMVLASGTDIVAATDLFTKVAHGFSTGDRIIYKSGTAAVAGLTDLSLYYIIKASVDTFQLATTQARAYTGTAVDITNTGTGNQTFYRGVYQIRMLGTDSTDVAQLPFEELVRVVVTSGASDTCTIEGIFIADKA